MNGLPGATAVATASPMRGRRLVVPSLFAADHAALADAAGEAVAAGARRLHIDLIDGRFAPGLGLSLGALGSLASRFPEVAFDVHLMVEEPAALAVEAAALGAASVTVHVEALAEPIALLRRLREAGTEPGLALNPSTMPDAVAGVADAASLLLVMFIEPGGVGQSARPEMLAKLGSLRQAHPRASIVADGGIDVAMARAAAAAGADHVVCGSALFRQGVAVSYPALVAAVERA